MFFRKHSSTILAALEIGTSKVAAALAESRSDGSMTLLGVGEVPSSGVRKGEIVDFEDAQKCVQQALHLAERQTDAEIGEIYLALTGVHITSRNDSVRASLVDDERTVSERHIEQLDQMAHHLVIPRDYVMMHSLLQDYFLDNTVSSHDPTGIMCDQIEGRYHLIYGLKSRLQTAVRCVRELDVNIAGYALASYAMSQAILSEEAQQAGSVAIDCGAGVTSYVVYLGGSVVHTGVLGLGGDHATQDLSMGLRLPYLKAEALKKEHGTVWLGACREEETVELPQDVSFEQRTIYKYSMVQILNARQREIFMLIAEDIERVGLWPKLGGGVYLTGGGSQIGGLELLAQSVFPMPVYLAHEHSFEGDQTYSHRPDLSTLLGLLYFAQQKERKKQGSLHTFWRLRQSVAQLFSAMKLF